MAVSHRLLLLIIWGFMALITLMIYGTSVSADEHLPTAGEILQNGKTLHKEVYLLRDNTDPEKRAQWLKTFFEYKTATGKIIYHVMYKEEYYLCTARSQELFELWKSISCYAADQDSTSDY